MRNYYAGLNGYGIGVTFTSNGWTAYRFDSEISKIVSDIIYKSEVITEGLNSMRPEE